MPDLHDPDRPGHSRQFDDELLGLDPDDPEAQAFAELDGVRDFAESANRAEGGRRWAAVLVVVLLLLGVAYVVWESLVFVVVTLL
jgi:hypothetical protein